MYGDCTSISKAVYLNKIIVTYPGCVWRSESEIRTYRWKLCLLIKQNQNKNAIDIRYTFSFSNKQYINLLNPFVNTSLI